MKCIRFQQGLVLVCAAAFGISPATGQEDLEGSGDHPEILRLADSYIVHHEHADYARLTIPTGPYRDGAVENSESLEGQVLKLSYLFRDGDVAELRVKRSYLEALEGRGFEILYTGSDAELGGRDGRAFLARGTNIFERGARGCCHLANRNRNIHYIAARSADGRTLAAIAIYNARRADGPTVAKAIVTADEMDTTMDHVPLSADEMQAGIVEHGRVAVQDILFEFDSDSILPDSADALATIAELMESRPDMRLLVVGHTDNVGDFDYNLQLSMTRAESVSQWLQDRHGIDGDRLQSAGAGMMAPITTNRTEEGRALNRRVELVER